MAGQVRQPIDVASLERYVAANVPEIEVPLDVKQVRDVDRACDCWKAAANGLYSSVMDNQTRRIN